MTLDDAGRTPGAAEILASWAGTAAFALTAGAVALGARGLEFAAVVVCVLLFAASIPLSLAALARGVARTGKGELVTISGLFFLARSAPGRVRRLLLGSLLANLAVTVLTASAAPFGTLTPIYPLSLAGLWAARHGTFPRAPEVPPPPPG
jgi:hypothetical protein